MAQMTAQNLNSITPRGEILPEGVKSMEYPVKLSICLITYNRAGYLNLLFQDLFQTRPFAFPFEVVVCDNHSTDQTPQVIEVWRAKHPEIRYFRQKFNVGPENNLASAYRLARGEFCVYLADDDRLVTDAVAEVVSYMEARPNLAVTHAPWMLWDDYNKVDLQQFYTIPQERVFTKGSAVDLFNMVMQSRIFPEVCVYRSAALHRMYTVTFNAYSPFVHLAHILDYGDVAFLPKSFYRQLMVGYVPSPQDHLGVQWTITRRDSFAAGFEYLAQKAFRHFGAATIPAEQVKTLQTMVMNFNNSQLAHGIRLLIGTKNYRGAYEFMVRQQANGQCDEAKAAEMRAFLMERASMQALIETFEAISILEEIAFFGVSNPEHLRGLVREQRPALEVRILTDDSLCGQNHPERILVLAGDGASRERLLAAGFLPGLVMEETDLNRLFVL